MPNEGPKRDDRVAPGTPPERARPSPSPATGRDIPSSLDRSAGTGRTGGTPPSDLPPGLDLSVGAGRTGTAPLSDAHAQALSAGTLLAGRYEIRALLGAGGMGAVYRVHDRERKKDVALKVMLPSLLAREKAVERFALEAEIMLGLSHEGIVRVYDVGADRERALRFYTMELLEGMSLRAWLDAKKQAREPVPAGEALEITRQLLEALKYAHRVTVHRDLKPENVFLLAESDGALRVKILDFGIAKLQSAAAFTSTSMALGTAYYMAPEQQLDSATVDARADLYALSVIFYEMLTAELPIGALKTPSAERRAKIEEWGGPRPADAAALPRGIDDLVMRGLDRKPQHRPESADRMLAEIAAIRALLEGGRRMRRGPLGAIALVALLGAAAIAFRERLLAISTGAKPAKEEAARAEPAPPLEPPRVAAPPASPPPAPALPPSAPAPPPPAFRFADVLPRANAVLAADSVVVKGRAEGAEVQRVEIDGVSAAVAEDGSFEVRIGLAEGKRAIRLEAFGAQGPIGALEQPIEIDRTPPLLALEGAVVTFTATPRATLRGTVEDAHAVTVLVNEIGVPVEGGRFAAEEALKEGENVFRIVARDIAGNETTAERRVILDRDPPRIEVVEPRDASATRAAEVHVRGQARDAHLAALFVRGAPAALSGEGDFDVAVPLEEGENAIEVVASDQAGNEARLTLHVLRDATAFALRVDPLPARAFRVTVAGEVGADDAVVTVDGEPAPLAGRRFSREFAIEKGEAVRTFRIVARAGAVEVAASAGPVAWPADADGKPLPEGAIAKLPRLAGRGAAGFSPDGRFLARCDGNEIQLLETARWTRIRNLVGHEKPVNAVAFSPDGKLIASGSADRTVRLWSAATGEEIRRVAKHDYPVRAVTFAAGGAVIASAGCGQDETAVRLTDVATGDKVAMLEGSLEGGICYIGSLAAGGAVVVAGGLEPGGASKGKVIEWISEDAGPQPTARAGGHWREFWVVASGKGGGLESRAAVALAPGGGRIAAADEVAGTFGGKLVFVDAPGKFRPIPYASGIEALTSRPTIRPGSLASSATAILV